MAVNHMITDYHKHGGLYMLYIVILCRSSLDITVVIIQSLIQVGGVSRVPLA
jgi:hypothetical protein